MNPATAVFLLSGLYLLYILFGYPLILLLLARRAHAPIHRRFEPKRVTVLMAVRNGEAWLARKLDSILALHYPKELLEIIVISDGSTDRTSQIAAGYAAQGVKLIETAAEGKALALNAGMAAATGEILFFTDVRQMLDPECLRHLIACLGDPAAGVVSGELIILDAQGREDNNTGLYWKYEKFIRKKLSRIDSLFGATGSIYAMHRHLAVPLPADCLLDDVYLPMAAFFRGYRLILEERARAYDVSNSLETEFRRKVRTLAGVYQIIGAYPGLLTHHNRMWFHFLSYKFGRLLTPFALLAIAGSTPLLPAPWSVAAGTGQAAFYGLALAGPWLPEPLRRLSSPARTFVVLMAATFCAMSILFVPARRLWSKPSG